MSTLPTNHYGEVCIGLEFGFDGTPCDENDCFCPPRGWIERAVPVYNKLRQLRLGNGHILNNPQVYAEALDFIRWMDIEDDEPEDHRLPDECGTKRDFCGIITCELPMKIREEYDSQLAYHASRIHYRFTPASQIEE